MDSVEALDKIKSVINALIKDNPEDPESVAAGHGETAVKDLHDVITAKMRDRIAGVQAPVEDPEVDPVIPTATAAPVTTSAAPAEE